MTLTSQLEDKDSPVRSFMDAEFPDLAALMRDYRPKWNIDRYIAPHYSMQGDQFGIVGMALDYRLRFYWNAAPMSSLVAYKGAMRHIAGEVDERFPGFSLFAGDLDARYDKFFESLGALAPRAAERRLSRDEEDELNAYCVALAYMEQLVRPVKYLSDDHPMRRAYSGAGEMLDIAPDYMLEDLRRLSWAFLDRHEYLLVQSIIPNPTFKGSVYVDGADADAIIGDEARFLVDFKTTKRPLLTADFRQALGYALLDLDDEYDISYIGIYYARQCEFLDVPLSALQSAQRDAEKSFSQLRSEFGDAIHASYEAICDFSRADFDSRFTKDV